MSHPPLSEQDRNLLRETHETVLIPSPPSNGQPTSFYKSALLVVVGITISLGAAYMREALQRAEYVTRSDLRNELVDARADLRNEMLNASPYVLEREMLKEWRKRTDERLQASDSDLKQLREALVAVQLRMATEHSPLDAEARKTGR